jgi:phosphate transport system substrate-binding protein
VFTDYLCKISGGWKSKVGANASIAWPVGLGGKGNAGIAALVRQTSGSIGYVEFTYAFQNHLLFTELRNSAGRFIRASAESITAAGEAVLGSMPNDYRVSITNAPGASSYPISSFTWLLIPGQISDSAKRTMIAAFLRHALTNGQDAAETLGYAPLPKDLAAQEVRRIEQIR